MSLQICAYVHSNDPTIKYNAYYDSIENKLVYKKMVINGENNTFEEYETTGSEFDCHGELVIYSNLDINLELKTKRLLDEMLKKNNKITKYK